MQTFLSDRCLSKYLHLGDRNQSPYLDLSMFYMLPLGIRKPCLLSTCRAQSRTACEPASLAVLCWRSLYVLRKSCLDSC
jgi:hypothetical protein